jgi:hypothetical protein
MVFLQMPIFDFDKPLPLTRRDKWLYFLKNLESFDSIPVVLSEPVFEKAFDTAEYIKFSPEMQAVYQNDLKIYRDNRNVVDTADQNTRCQPKYFVDLTGNAASYQRFVYTVPAPKDR